VGLDREERERERALRSESEKEKRNCSLHSRKAFSREMSGELRMKAAKKN
jgi:hypothetical protein